MMMRRTELKRTGFKRRSCPVIHKSAALGPACFEIDKHAQEREQRISERAKYAIENALKKPPNLAQVSLSTPAAPVEKESPLRSEAYRRAVASLPCIHCGIEGYSQCAHANTGKGTGTKSSDTESFPLCACQPGRRGCHSLFDQGALFSKEARRAKEAEWAAKTRLQILSSGLWPARLPVPNN